MTTARVLALTTVLLCEASFAQTAYRCKDAKGQTVYQQAPCEPGAGGSRVNLSVNSLPGPSAGERNTAATADRNLRMRIAMSEHRVVIGMTEAELVESWGQPAKINTDFSESGASKQWIYRRGSNGDQYVYTSNGTVTAIQDRPSQQVSRGCVNSTDYRNAQVGANSIALPYAEQQARRRALAKLTPC